MNPEPTHKPTIDDMINLPIPGDAQISPDGKHIAYTLGKPDWEENQRITQLWLMGEGLSEPRQLTFSKKGSSNPRWSPDGRWLAFLSKREKDEATQIYRISPFGGEAQTLTSVKGSIGSFAWSPDGQQIAFTLVETDTPQQKERKEKYGEYRVEDEDYQRAHLWLLEVETQKTRQLTAGDQLHIVSLNWSPDGGQIAFEAWPSPDMKDYGLASIHVFDLDTHNTQLLVEERAASPFWSPDSKQIAFVRYPETAMYHNSEICVIDAASHSKPRVITADFDEDPMLLAWAPNGIYFNAMQRVGMHLYRIDPVTGRHEQVTPADQPGWINWDYSFSRDFSQIGAAAANEAHTTEILRIDAKDRSITRLTDYDNLVAGWNLAQKELIQWTSQDGTLIEGVLTKPLNFDPSKQYPLLVVIHGGPTWMSLLGKLTGPEKGFYPCQQWAQKGALILEPNYRGSGGYGEAFRSLNVRNLGVGDYWDVISGVDALIAKGWVDPERVGAMGWSQGGYISAFITTYSDRFKAVSVGAGISNWVTYYVNTDIHPFTRDYLSATPWEDMEVYQKTSPMTHIRKAQTPTLIQHGDQDTRVPIPNAYELYQGLLDLGVEARLQVYPGMPHSTRKPRTQRHIMETNFEWFNRWIWGEAPAKKEENTIYVVLGGGEKDPSEENLPLIERYKGKQIQDVYHWARRDGVGFFLFSGEFGLVDADFPTPPAEKALLPEDVSAMALHLTETLRDEGVKRVRFYTPPVKENPWVLIYLGCLQVAAGIAGGIEIDHQERTAEAAAA